MLGCALLLGATGADAADPSEDSFRAGRGAFERGDYSTALIEFENAVASGMTGPAVHFNIGVAAWRSGDLARADAEFREVARTPAMAALAHYNLGLVALKRDDVTEARHWFQLTQSEGDDQRLQDLAAEQLHQLPPPPQRNWTAYAAAAAGYDDNIALISTTTLPTTTDVGDSFLEAQLAFSIAPDPAWQFDASAFTIDYLGLDTFDQQGVQAGAVYRHALGDWSGEAGLQMTYATIDGEGLERIAIATLAAARSLSTNLRLQTRYRYYDIDGLNDFTGLSGHRHEVAARLQWRQPLWELSAELLADDGSYQQQALSASRYQFSGEAERRLPAGWTISGELRRRHSRYDAGGGSEDLNELALTVRKELTPRWRLFARYAYAQNDATQPAFEYHRNRLTAGVDAIW
jgi:Tetratricopeptide repeat